MAAQSGSGSGAAAVTTERLPVASAEKDDCRKKKKYFEFYVEKKDYSRNLIKEVRVKTFCESVKNVLFNVQ